MKWWSEYRYQRTKGYGRWASARKASRYQPPPTIEELARSPPMTNYVERHDSARREATEDIAEEVLALFIQYEWVSNTGPTDLREILGRLWENGSTDGFHDG